MYLCRCLFLRKQVRILYFPHEKQRKGSADKPDSRRCSFPQEMEEAGGSPEGAEVQNCTLFSPLWALFGYFLARQKVTTSRPQTRREQRKKITLIFRQHRTNEVVGWRMDFSSDANANFEGLLAVNREICMTQMAEKTSTDAPPNCAVVP